LIFLIKEIRANKVSSHQRVKQKTNYSQCTPLFVISSLLKCWLSLHLASVNLIVAVEIFIISFVVVQSVLAVRQITPSENSNSC
jgi:hypothetical protein